MNTYKNYNNIKNLEDIEEGFHNILNRDLALRALLFSMVFYIVSSPVVIYHIKKRLPVNLVETLIVQALLFGILFYIINSHL